MLSRHRQSRNKSYSIMLSHWKLQSHSANHEWPSIKTRGPLPPRCFSGRLRSETKQLLLKCVERTDYSLVFPGKVGRADLARLFLKETGHLGSCTAPALVRSLGSQVVHPVWCGLEIPTLDLVYKACNCGVHVYRHSRLVA